MNDKTPIRALIEAVEAGTATDPTSKGDHGLWLIWSVFPPSPMDDNSGNVGDAYHGSLDAALSLHEALLPGWKKILNFNEFADGSAVCTMFGPMPEDAGKWDMAPAWAVRSDHPARAWLLAILKAYEAKQ